MATTKLSGRNQAVNTSLIDLRAEVAKRAEDLRIATKHRIEAAERIGIEENVSAYKRAMWWENKCRQAEQEARGRLIRATA